MVVAFISSAQADPNWMSASGGVEGFISCFIGQVSLGFCAVLNWSGDGRQRDSGCECILTEGGTVFEDTLWWDLVRVAFVLRCEARFVVAPSGETDSCRNVRKESKGNCAKCLGD